MVSHAIPKPAAVNGMYLRRPPIRRMSWVSSVPWITVPEPRKSAAL